MKATFKKLVRFGLVGASGFVIDFAVTWLMLSPLGVNKYVSNTLGFTVAATTNYILNRRWTWRSDNPNIGGEFLKFFVVSLAGLGLNSLIIYIFINYVDFHGSIAGVTLSSFWVAKIVATAVVMLWNFAANNLFTFRER